MSACEKKKIIKNKNREKRKSARKIIRIMSVITCFLPMEKKNGREKTQKSGKK